MKTAYVSFRFSAVGEALITFCVEAEKIDMMHARANVLLFDFFGLRKDAYDRFHNEEVYLEHMNSSADDKRIILDYIKGYDCRCRSRWWCHADMIEEDRG